MLKIALASVECESYFLKGKHKHKITDELKVDCPDGCSEYNTLRKKLRMRNTSSKVLVSKELQPVNERG